MRYFNNGFISAVNRGNIHSSCIWCSSGFASEH